MLTGKWTYRSFRNEAGIVGSDAAAALALIFGEGVFDLQAESETRFRGALGMGSGYALTLAGECRPGRDGAPTSFSIVGEGLEGTATAGWRYDYRGEVGYSWPDAVDQIPCLLGTVIRVRAHGADAPAGVTASFVAVRHLVDQRPNMKRRFALMSGQ